MNLLNNLQQNLFEKEQLDHKALRDGFGEALLELGEERDDIVALAADLTESTRAKAFADRFTDRFFEVGVAEQNMIGVSAGLALAGKTPFACSFACFNPGRNWEQIRLSVAYSNTNVKIVGSHAGLSNSPDGGTHQSLEDIALLRVMPNMTVVVPSDSLQTKAATHQVARMNGPAYLRLARHSTPVFATTESYFEIGKANILNEGNEVTIVSCGLMVYESLKLVKYLEERGISAELIEMHTIKPLDKDVLVNSVAKTKLLVTIEEHQVAGGLGSACLEALANKNPVRTLNIGINDEFGQSARKPEELYEHYELTAEQMIDRVTTFIQNK